jgi:hypothetical protein
MVFMADLFHQIWNACLQLLGQPFYYIGILFVVLQYRRQMRLERKMFHTKLHSFFHETWKTLLWAIAAGFIASLVMVPFGTVLQPSTILWIWIIALLLICFRARFFCFAYSIGVIGILHSLVTYFPFETNVVLFDNLITTLQGIRMSSLLALVAVVHFIEALWIRWIGSNSAHPVVLDGKRGRLVGGFQIQGFWPVPLFLMVPVDAGSGISLNWTPFMAGDMWANGWMLLAFPIVMGYSEVTKSWLPKAKAKLSSAFILLYSCIIMILAFGVEYWSVLTLLASLLCILLHEAVIWFSLWKEGQKGPYYVHDNRGLFVLGTISGSPAEELGIKTGEVIRQVNGMKVRTREELHQAFNINSAFCKLEVLNLEGESKFLKRAMFSGEHHQLGLVLAPDEDAEYYVGMKSGSIFSYLGMNAFGVLKKRSSRNWQTHLDSKQATDSDSDSKQSTDSKRPAAVQQPPFTEGM